MKDLVPTSMATLCYPCLAWTLELLQHQAGPMPRISFSLGFLGAE